MFKKIVFVSLMVACVPLHTEYLLYRVDNRQTNKIGKLSYDRLSADEQKNLWQLYESTVYRYQWPTVIRFFYPSEFYPKFKFRRGWRGKEAEDLQPDLKKPFSPEEANQYLQALQTPRGLFLFIQNKVKEQSGEKYNLVWIPTIIFELFVISGLDFAKIYSEKAKTKNSDVKATFAIYCNTIDKIISATDLWYADYSSDSFLDHIIKSCISKEFFYRLDQEEEEEKETMFAKVFPDRYQVKNEQELLSKALPITKDIIKKYLIYEQTAFDNNQSILVRGTSGFGGTGGFRGTYDSDPTAGLQAFDYKFGGFTEGLSYGYSLFAGSLFDLGACALSYILQPRKIGYLLLIDLKDYFLKPYTYSYVFALPPVGTIEGIFSSGENFHPRLNALEEIPISELGNMELGLARYLSQAKLIKLSQSQQSSQKKPSEDMNAQQATLINELLQEKSYMESEERLQREKLLQEHQEQLKKIAKSPKQILNKNKQLGGNWSYDAVSKTSEKKPSITEELQRRELLQEQQQQQLSTIFKDMKLRSKSSVRVRIDPVSGKVTKIDPSNIGTRLSEVIDVVSSMNNQMLYTKKSVSFSPLRSTSLADVIDVVSSIKNQKK